MLLPIPGPRARVSGGFLRGEVSRSPKESPEPPKACRGLYFWLEKGGSALEIFQAVPELSRSNNRLIPVALAEDGCSSEPKP